MNTKWIVTTLCLLASSLCCAHAASPAQTSVAKPEKKQVAAQSQTSHENEGERVFNQNCSRCHNTPEGFSPRISGTVARHMRVRASLGAEEEKQLLRFLNP